MPPVSATRKFEIVTAALAMAEERGFVALTDAAGHATPLELGSVAVPESIPNELVTTLTTFNLDGVFKEISLNRWRKEGREKLAEHLRAGQLARVLAADETRA